MPKADGNFCSGQLHYIDVNIAHVNKINYINTTLPVISKVEVRVFAERKLTRIPMACAE